jgi:hypothetical protein
MVCLPRRMMCGLQEFHDDQRLTLVEMVEPPARGPDLGPGLPGQGVVFEEGALERERPAFAHKAYVRQRLLDDRRLPASGPRQ